MASEVKEEMKESCEMENSEVRFYNVRSSKGRFPFLNKVSYCDVYFSSLCFSFVQILPDVPEPPMYWIDTDPRAEAAHMGEDGKEEEGGETEGGDKFFHTNV